MLIFGVIHIIGVVAKISIPYTIDVVVLVIGVVLGVLGARGHAVRGREHFF